jgi:hypothetical protein
MPKMDDKASTDTEIEYNIDVMVLDYLCTKATYQALIERVAEIKQQQPREESNEDICLFDSMPTQTYQSESYPQY